MVDIGSGTGVIGDAKRTYQVNKASMHKGARPRAGLHRENRKAMFTATQGVGVSRVLSAALQVWGA